MTSRFLDALRTRALLLDAGMGVRLMGLGLDPRFDDPALWNLAHPEAVRDVHAWDVAAGSDVVLANTFGANAPWLSRFGAARHMPKINRRALGLAREAAGPSGFVLGSIGPVAAEAPHSVARQGEVLARGRGRADGLILETYSVARALDGLAALRPAVGLPILVSLATPFHPDDAQRLVDAGAAAFGVNCVHPADARRRIESIAGMIPVPLLWKPGASHPDGPSISPDAFAAEVSDLLALGVRLFGGCCGATEAHVAALRAALDRLPLVWNTV